MDALLVLSHRNRLSFLVFTHLFILISLCQDFPGDSDSKESAFNARDTCLTPGLGRCPGRENGNPLQYSCLENSMNKGAWWATVHGVAKGRT